MHASICYPVGPGWLIQYDYRSAGGNRLGLRFSLCLCLLSCSPRLTPTYPLSPFSSSLLPSLIRHVLGQSLLMKNLLSCVLFPWVVLVHRVVNMCFKNRCPPYYWLMSNTNNANNNHPLFISETSLQVMLQNDFLPFEMCEKPLNCE